MRFVATLEGNYFYLATEEADGDAAPLLEIRFTNEFQKLSRDTKLLVALKMAESAADTITAEKG